MPTPVYRLFIQVDGQSRRKGSLSGSGDEGKKRKIGDTSISEPSQGVLKKREDPVAFVLMEALQATVRGVNELNRRIFEHPSTKKEIKETAAKLKRSIEVFCRDTTKEWLEGNKWQPVEMPRYDVAVQTDPLGDRRDNRMRKRRRILKRQGRVEIAEKENQGVQFLPRRRRGKDKYDKD